MLDKAEVIEMLWNMNHEIYMRSLGARDRAENAEMRGDLDSVEFWEQAADQYWFEAGAILKAIRAIEEM